MLTPSSTISGAALLELLRPHVRYEKWEGGPPQGGGGEQLFVNGTLLPSHTPDHEVLYRLKRGTRKSMNLWRAEDLFVRVGLDPSVLSR